MHQINLTRKNIIFIMISLMISLLLAALDSTIVGTAMPKIISDLKGMEHYSLPFTIYMLCSTIAILIFGKLSDIYGRKPIFISGIVTFLISSIFCGLSQNMMQFVIFRGFQGVGGGILISNVFIIVGELFPPAKRGKYMGIVSSMFGLSSVIGPSIGGFITDTLSWRWVFYVNIPMGIISLALVCISLPYIRYKDVNEIIDFKGISVFLLSIVPMFLALAWAGTKFAWNSLQITLTLVFSTVMMILFVFVEKRSKEPMLDMTFFKNPVFNISSIVMFLSNAVMFSGIVYVPLFVQAVLGQSASASGAITTPMSLSIAVASITSGQIVSRLGKYKTVAIVSILTSIAGIALLTTININNSAGLIIIYSTILGLGVGGIIPIFNVASQNVFEHRDLGIVTSSLAFFRNMGAAVGTAVFGYVLKSSMNRGFSSLNFANIPQNIREVLENTRMLSDKNLLTDIQSHVQPEFVDTFNQLILRSKFILADSIHRIFIVTLVIAILSLFFTFLLKEVPLKHHNYN